MSEFENPTGISRRNLLKAGAIGIAGGFGAAEVKEELVNKTIETPSGRFTGLYEKHSESTNERQLTLPPDTNFLFREGIGPLSDTLRNLEKTVTFNNNDFSLFSPYTLIDAAKRQIPIVFGDSYIKFFEGINYGVNFFDAFVGIESIYLLDKMKSKEGEKSTTIKRRKMLKTFTALTAAWGLSSLAKTMSASPLGEKHDAMNRIFSQFSNIASMGHPEDIVVFFRNALMAEKMLKLAEEQKKLDGKKSHIAYNVGWAHRGIEDFLIAGREICQGVIKSYPSPVLRHIVESNGGRDDFSSILLYELPHDLTLEAISTSNLNGEATKITDQELAKTIENKLQ